MTGLQEKAQELAGNHRRFDSFAWFERPADDENWTLVYTHHRDSDLLDESNAEVIARELEPFIESGDVVPENHSHWAVGWVSGYAIRVYRDGDITEAFRTWTELQERIADYPLLDEEDHSRREFDSAIEAIGQEGRRHVSDDAPEDWAFQVWEWLWNCNQRELENRDGHGAYPSEEAIIEALDDLGFLAEE